MTELNSVTQPDFEAFRKIARLRRECVITEKIDGTNAQVLITDEGDVHAGSRNCWLQAGKSDNYGFAAWVEAHKQDLLKLGPGRHFGEWWGSGIQRGYGLQKGEKRFSLFNVARWYDAQNPPLIEYAAETAQPCPACCGVVPVLFRGMFNTLPVEQALNDLREYGSYAAPYFMDPEGVVIYHSASGQLFKKTIKGDEVPKGMQAEA
jgi:hypothetical protein